MPTGLEFCNSNKEHHSKFLNWDQCVLSINFMDVFILNDTENFIVKVRASIPGDLALNCGKKVTNQKHLNAQLCSEMFDNDFRFSVCYLLISFTEFQIRKHFRTCHSIYILTYVSSHPMDWC